MLWLSVDRSLNIPLIRQIYEQIRLKIIHGELRQGEKLPSTRELAETLQVSRNVILEAYDQLAAEGYMISFQGAGTFVAEGASLNQYPAKSCSQKISLTETDSRSVIDFRFGVPALDLFPRKKWGRLVNNIYMDAPTSAWGYGTPEGRDELRRVLAHYLVGSRGVHCEPEQIIITTGAIQAVFIAAKMLLSAGDQVITENYLNNGIRKIFSGTGAEICPIPVDEQGIKADLISNDARPRLIYITPSHQFPLGGTLPIQRRIELLHIARKTDSYILEDNYDNEFRFAGTPVSSLQGLDPERVIYIGTFSKILAPALRIGYLVVPEDLVKKSRKIKDLLDHHSPTLNQLVLAEFIAQGFFDRHIAKMKKVYRRRQETIIESLKSYFPGRFEVSGHSTGLHLIVEFHNVEFNEQLVNELEQAGVRVYPVEMYAVNQGFAPNKAMLGYGNLNEKNIMEGIRRMKSVIK